MTTLAIVKTLADFAEPWAKLFKDSKPVQVGVTFAHLGGLVMGGGLAIAKDFEVMRAVRSGVAEPAMVTHDRAAVHRTVLLALVVIVLSGLALLAADVETYLVSPVYWTKMSLVALLLVNGAWMLRVEARAATAPGPSDPAWRSLRAASIMSAILWMSIVLMGVWLVEAA